MVEQIEATAVEESIDLDNLPPGGEPGEVPVNKAQVAEALGWSLPTVDNKIRAGMPVAAKGTHGRAYAFYLSQVKAWLQRREAAERELAERQAAQVREMQQALNLTGGANGKDHQADPRLRAEALAAELQHIRVARLRGELCEASVVRETLFELVAFLGDRLQSLPDYLERRAGLTSEVTAQVVEAIDAWQEQLQRDAARELAPAGEGVAAGAAGR